MPDEMAGAPGNYGDAEMPEQPEGKPAEEKKEPEEHLTAVVPIALCPGMKPGDEMVVRILAVHEKDYEVEYAPEKGSEEKPAAPPAESGAPNEASGGTESMYG